MNNLVVDDPWSRVCSCLSSLLSASGRSRAFAVHRGLPKTLLATLQAVRDHLSVLGKPIETIKNANHVCNKSQFYICIRLCLPICSLA